MWVWPGSTADECAPGQRQRIFAASTEVGPCLDFWLMAIMMNFQGLLRIATNAIDFDAARSCEDPEEELEKKLKGVVS